jgi:SAM-dependent methyltransferase
MSVVSFDRAAEYYDETRGYAVGVDAQIRDAIVQALQADRSTRFLEIGIGTGRIALPFLQAGYHYLGIDIALSMMQRLRARLGPVAQPPGLVQATAAALPFASAGFDVVIAVHIFHLIAEWRQALVEVRRILRSGGVLLLAGDEPPDAHSEQLPPQQAIRQWNVIRAELGYARGHGQPGVRWTDPPFQAQLAATGAGVRELCLAEFRRPPFSARDVLRRCRTRIYSSDWALPDDVHGEALRRLALWIDTECPDPESAYSVGGQFIGRLITW